MGVILNMGGILARNRLTIASETQNLFLTVVLGLATLLPTSSAIAQSTRPSNSWLDRPPTNWNKQSSGFPSLPNPVPATNLDRCRESVREPDSLAEKALVRRGWKLFGASQNYGITQLVMAASGFDGMCRPVGYQAFVYVEGRYAGTLSPVLMDSRTDGALIEARLLDPKRISAEFARYSADDPLCCPTKTSSASYAIRNDEVPDLTVAGVVTSINCRDNPQTSDRPSENPAASNDVATLFNQRWTLTEINNRQISSSDLYIEFDPKEQRFAGNSGCNRFAGGFTSSGDTLKLSRVISTRRACIGSEAQRNETEFLRSLESVTRFETQSDTLRLYAGDRVVLVFKNR
jgi:heat shock protein HslJ